MFFVHSQRLRLSEAINRSLMETPTMNHQVCATYIHTYIHTHTHTYTYTHTHTHTHTHAHAHTHTHMHTHIHTRTHTHTHTHTHARTHTRTHARTHTHSIHIIPYIIRPIHVACIKNMVAWSKCALFTFEYVSIISCRYC